MVESTVILSFFIIDSRASRHMVSTREAFSSLDGSNGTNILLGDNYETKSKGKGRIDIDHGFFNNVLYFLFLNANLFPVY